MIKSRRSLPGLLGEDYEHAGLLVEDTLELLVEDHLAQLLLHLGLGQPDLARHVLHLHLAVRLDDPAGKRSANTFLKLKNYTTLYRNLPDIQLNLLHRVEPHIADTLSLFR